MKLVGFGIGETLFGDPSSPNPLPNAVLAIPHVILVFTNGVVAISVVEVPPADVGAVAVLNATNPLMISEGGAVAEVG
jgi:hypothetical protein